VQRPVARGRTAALPPACACSVQPGPSGPGWVCGGGERGGGGQTSCAGSVLRSMATFRLHGRPGAACRHQTARLWPHAPLLAAVRAPSVLMLYYEGRMQRQSAGWWPGGGGFLRVRSALPVRTAPHAASATCSRAATAQPPASLQPSITVPPLHKSPPEQQAHTMPLPEGSSTLPQPCASPHLRLVVPRPARAAAQMPAQHAAHALPPRRLVPLRRLLQRVARQHSGQPTPLAATRRASLRARTARHAAASPVPPEHSAPV
jgi:hypothetical protein